MPLGEARLGRITFDEWLRRSQAGALSRIRRSSCGLEIHIHLGGEDENE